MNNGQQENGSEEFEKRITDIKAKLNQIKNTINSEIETSFVQLNHNKTNGNANEQQDK